MTNIKPMENKDIDKAARELRETFEGKYGSGSNFRYEDIANWIEETFHSGAKVGAQSRQSEIDELIEALEEISKRWHEFDNYSNGDDGYYIGLELSIKGVTQLLEKYGKKAESVKPKE